MAQQSPERICLQCRRPQYDSWVWKIHWRRESQAPCRAVCRPCGFFRMMHGVVSAPSCCAFTHRVAFEEVSGQPPGSPSLWPPDPAGGWAGRRLLHRSWPSCAPCHRLGLQLAFLLSDCRKGLSPMLFTRGQFLLGFRGRLLAVSKQPLPELASCVTDRRHSDTWYLPRAHNLVRETKTTPRGE